MSYEQRNAYFPADYQFNLSDFALFLSVMKHERAYECVLSIIMDEPEIKLREVKVEQVILNRQGKRAIRLDAWALSEDERQFNMEMQNDSKGEDIPKRSRFYQGLMDSPILKAGKKTKYRQLPSTVIIFITQEDIFGRDFAKYTFLERCEELSDLYLEDGTKKIFLNMSSKNGSQELVSLLQYMKNTKIDNPEILVKDSRILELDGIVTEVKESEEWEAVKMNILEVGIARGREEGKAEGELLKLLSLIQKKQRKGCSVREIADALEESEAYIEKILSLLGNGTAGREEELLKKIKQIPR